MRLKIFNPKKWTYLAQGALRRLNQPKHCPCCGDSECVAVDRKYFHTLEECDGCGILFRYPSDSTAKLVKFYQQNYAEPGLTTELPSPEALRALITSGFKGSQRDFSKPISLLKALGLKAGDNVLDFGASWGYGTWQLVQAGFQAVGFDISKARAKYGSRLGLTIETDSDRLNGPFDAVYSCHVLEHVDNPLAALRQHLQWTRSGGYVVAHTPNGSAAWRTVQPESFRHIWGQVHPFLLTDNFITKLCADRPFYIGSEDQPDEIRKWDQKSQFIGPVDGPWLFFVIRNQSMS